MELRVFFISVLCFTFFALQTPCTSLQIQVQSSNDEQAKEVHQLSLYPTLPRKLRITKEVAVKGKEAHRSISNSKQKEYVSGKAYQKEQATIMHGGISRGTRQQWVEAAGPDISQYFTMDYSHVRRRRPIHNKSLPVGP